jgi:16S rRNA (guanine527-N7)-methyltransferase
VTLSAELRRGLDALQLTLSAEVERRLLQYIALVEKWNSVYNLTAVRDADKMLTHHVFDSLAVVPYFEGHEIVDVGSGAGLPGIPGALARADARFTLIEASHKKSAFLRQAAIELQLTNVDIQQVRAEAWRPERRFETVVSRAFSDLSEFVSVAGHLCCESGLIAAMKGVYPWDELNAIPRGFRVEEVKPISVPGLDAQRHLVLIRRAEQNG